MKNNMFYKNKKEAWQTGYVTSLPDSKSLVKRFFHDVLFLKCAVSKLHIRRRCRPVHTHNH